MLIALRNLLKTPQIRLCSLVTARLASTVASELSKWTEKLTQEQISEPQSSVNHLIAHVLRCDFAEIDRNLSKELSESEVNELETLVYARLAHMPVQYIIKEWDFRSLRGLKMLPPVFIPRPETEELVTYVENDLKTQKLDNFSFLEVGCGSGVISISLLTEFPNARGFCFDQNQLAVDLTKANAEQFGVHERLEVQKYKLIDGNLPSKEAFDLIVSNPPYLLSRELPFLANDIKIYEDMRALDGGLHGLSVIDNILKVAEKYLKKGGSLWLETHPLHPKLLRKKTLSQLEFRESLKDYCDKERFIKFVKK